MGTPLENVRVLEVNRMAPGAFCCMVLADMGCDVIRIEEPGGGRRTQRERELKAPAGARGDTDTPALGTMNRGKRSLVLNLKSAEGRDLFYKLVKTADVVIEGFRPGVVKKLGVDYETLREINPRISYCSISGYGQSGPYRDLVGHDINYLSLAGALSLCGPKGGRPYMPSNLLADYGGAGQTAIIGILLALLARERTGRGQYIDISLSEAVLGLMVGEVNTYMTSGKVPLRGETRLTGSVPHYNAYQTKDGKYISLGCNEPYFFESLVKALGREDLGAHMFSEGDKPAEIFAFFEETFRTKTAAEWFAELKDLEIAITPVQTVDEVVADAHFRERGLIVKVEHPLAENFYQVGTPIKLSDTPANVGSVAPLRGEHTAAILGELGFGQEQMVALVRAGITEVA